MTFNNQFTVFHQKCFIWRADEGVNVSQLAKVVLLIVGRIRSSLHAKTDEFNIV